MGMRSSSRLLRVFGFRCQKFLIIIATRSSGADKELLAAGVIINWFLERAGPLLHLTNESLMEVNYYIIDGCSRKQKKVVT